MLRIRLPGFPSSNLLLAIRTAALVPVMICVVVVIAGLVALDYLFGYP